MRAHSLVSSRGFPLSFSLVPSRLAPIARTPRTRVCTNAFTRVCPRSRLRARLAEIYRVFLENREGLERFRNDLSQREIIALKNGVDTCNIFLNASMRISLSGSKERRKERILIR